MSLVIDLDWPPARISESDDVADVRIAVHDRLVTQLFDLSEDRVRDHFRASAVSLAFWFADNWWRLRCEPMGDPRFVSVEWRQRHELSSGSSNELWPPLMIYGVGPRVLIAPVSARHQAETIRYLEDRPHTLLGSDYETGIDRLLLRVLQDCTHHEDAQALSTLVRQLQTERNDEELAGWRRLEACLGYDPDAAPESVVAAMVELERQVGNESVEEAAVAAPGTRAPLDLAAAVEAAEASTVQVDFSALEHLSDLPEPRGLTPWQAAEDAAIRLREILGLPDAITGEVLGDLLRSRWTDLKQATATARNLPYGSRVQSDDRRARLALQMNPLIDRRFEIARTIGDQLWTKGRGLGVVSRTRTDRQKYQRAFAQAFLCPMRRLRDIIDLNRPTAVQISRAARFFEVRDRVIMAILINRGYLPQETTAHALEAA